MAPDTVSHEKFTVASNAVTEGEVIRPAQLVADLGGENLSPDLAWSGAPENARSFAVTCFDPDAPTGSGFWHWIAYNIPVETTALSTGQPRSDTGYDQASNDYGTKGYDGPHPPEGEDHRYIWTVHALSIPHIDLPEDTPHVQIRFMIHTHEVARAQVSGHFRNA
ncbi:YbhB/YbcL family Raf kinase inhibitor-like protein [Devriesea agamarum]|uniref:YbhB/YbcL family Raf kinase inhibitor-like protein n=1 Tax=Devriesea agamarum TaxID=472569 RepID=UPI00071E416F|nr:YbhB/YbcL family Raf kinase inhibitor-like protein [Devriesea agamarum]